MRNQDSSSNTAIGFGRAFQQQARRRPDSCRCPSAGEQFREWTILLREYGCRVHCAGGQHRRLQQHRYWGNCCTRLATPVVATTLRWADWRATMSPLPATSSVSVPLARTRAIAAYRPAFGSNRADPRQSMSIHLENWVPQVSSARFKDEIKPINQASEAIHRLRPVSFRYKAQIEPTRPVGFGLIAEEVEKINPDLVSRDTDGKPLGLCATIR